MTVIDVIIPARNEEDTVEPIVNRFVNHRSIGNVIVVIDADTTDQTGIAAISAGGIVISGRRLGIRGKGQCVKLGLNYVKSSQVILCDADLTGLTQGHVSQLASGRFVIGIPDFPLEDILASEAVLNRPGWFNRIMVTWGVVSGERQVPADVLHGLDLHGYLMEAQINKECIQRRIRPEFQALSGLRSPFRMTQKRLDELVRDMAWGTEHGVFG